MTLCSSSSPWRLSSRKLFSRHGGSQLRNASGSPTDPVVELAPSQILRFSLTGTTMSNCYEAMESNESGADRVIQNLFDKWAPNTPPPPELTLLRPKRNRLDSPMLEDHVQQKPLTIRQVQILIERSVHQPSFARILQAGDCQFLRTALSLCERYNSYSEILCAVNGIVARSESLGVRVSRSLHVLGMRYACLSLSGPALYHHLQRFRQTDPKRLRLKDSLSLVSSLLHAMKSIRVGNPGYSTVPILQVVTGEGETQYNCRLHDSLFWANPDKPIDYIHDYVLLLIKLESHSLLHQVLDQSLKAFFPGSPFLFQVTCASVMGLVDRGESKQAATYLWQISQQRGDGLPRISRSRDLRDLLADKEISELLPKAAGERDHMGIILHQLLEMEKRLGIRWLPQQSVHASICDMRRIASGEPLFTPGGDCAGFDSAERLIETVLDLGCSSKLGDLGEIADQLNERDGTEIPVTLQPGEDDPYELAWRPQCSPIEFSNALPPTRHDSSAPWSPSALGLLRGRLDNAGIPQENERSLHLMQLGYLVLRPHKQKLRETQSDDDHRWRETGHIVTWDRVDGGFLIVFLGKGHGTMDPGLPPRSQQPPTGFSSIREIFMSRAQGRKPKVGMHHSRFHFDVDPVQSRRNGR